MDKNIAPASRRRRILAGWAAAACGLVTLGTTATALMGGEPNRHRDVHGAGQLRPVSAEHSRAADQAPRRFGGTSLQKADTAGLWDDYRRGGPSHPSAQRPVGASVCECDRGGHLSNPLFRVLDGFAGGIEQAVGLDRPSLLRKDTTCDDGCDAVTRKELRQLDVRAVPMVKPIVPAPRVDKPAKRGHMPEGSRPESRPDEQQHRSLPEPVHPDAEIDPFADEAAWTPGRNPAIERSAYFE